MRGGREAIKARQHDQEQRGAWQRQKKVRQSLPQHRGGRRAAARRAQARYPHEQSLLQDQHESRRHDVARVTADRVEDWLQ